jgi:hypothetical protein
MLGSSSGIDRDNGSARAASGHAAAPRDELPALHHVWMAPCPCSKINLARLGGQNGTLLLAILRSSTLIAMMQAANLRKDYRAPRKIATSANLCESDL